MSRKHIVANAVVEWSPTMVSWVHGNALHTADSFAEAASQLPGRDVVVAISRRAAFVRAYRVPNTGRAEVRRILSMQIGQLFPIPASELSFDFHLTHDVDAEGRLAIVAAMRSSDLQSMQEQAKAAGLRVVQVVPAALGSPILAKSLHLDDAAVVHRTIEGLAIDLVVGGELRYSRVAAMPPTAIGIEGEVSRTFAAAVLSCSPTIAAGALLLPDAEAATELWGTEALIGSDVEINLETPAQLAARERSRQGQRTRLSLLLLAAASLLFAGVYLRWDDAAKKASATQAKWSGRLSTARRARDIQLTKARELDSLLAVLDRGFHPAQSISDVVTLVSNATPKGIWLTGFAVERGKVMTIRGTATRGDAVPLFQQALVAEPRFRDVTMVFANDAEIEKQPVVQFSISLFPVGNLPLIDPDANKKKGAKK